MAVIKSTRRGMALDRAIIRPAVVAFDRASVRSVDQDGRLHVAVSNMSKATVSPYYGREIPNSDVLGLSPDRVYYLLRDPAELRKAVASFNNLPILSKHIPVTASAPQQSLVIGSTGTDAAFVAPYLQNSAVIWVQSAIDDINAKRKKEWSCGYYYRADMTPGNFNGLRYDGIMRDIVGNHVALVDQGRAGPDVMVGDALPEGLFMLKSRRGLMLHGAIAALIAPRLAQDAKLDLSEILGGATAAGKGKDSEELAGKVVAAATPMLAADAALETADVAAAILAVDASDDTPADDDSLDDGDDDDAKAAKAAAAKAKKDKEAPAMDAAAIRAEAIAEMGAMRDAERAVAPFIGEVKVAMDSAAGIYKLALDHFKIDLTDVDPSAYKALVSMLPKAKETPVVALDHAGAAGSVDALFGASHLLAN